MKRIIKNKLYDTDTAVQVFEDIATNYRNGEGQCMEQRLYRKQRGDFFLWLLGPVSNASHNIGINNCPHDKSRQIFVLTYDQAREWAEQTMPAEKYLEIFGEPEDDGSTADLMLRISSAKVTKLKQQASKTGKTLTEIIEEMIDAL